MKNKNKNTNQEAYTYDAGIESRDPLFFHLMSAQLHHDIGCERKSETC
jgi:hypothetical protein